jgi:hypothetical protein
VLVRYADDLLAMCRTRQEAERALAALTAILAELGLELKPAKTRIVHLTEGGTPRRKRVAGHYKGGFGFNPLLVTQTERRAG